MTRVLLATPRGFCAGVDRAVGTVERALAVHGPPVYVRKHIVHNLQVVRELEARGAIFVESEEDVPEEGTVVLAAHGVEPGVYRRAAARRLTTIDATCPLVKKVHAEVTRYAAGGYTVVLVGHAGHDEVIGTAGHAPESVVLVETADQARALELPDARRIAYVTQTTLSLDETARIIAILRARFPAIVGPRKEDICYATTNRQRAVKEMLGEIDVLLVVGSHESSNSKRLVDTARAGGVRAYLIEDQGDIDESELADAGTIGLTAGASTPERLVTGVCEWFRSHGVTDFVTVGDDRSEGVSFRLPAGLWDDAAPERSVASGSPS
jgi:4-hydroxy-3-methylbut-2-enyl diphosphate reductase